MNFFKRFCFNVTKDPIITELNEEIKIKVLNKLISKLNILNILDIRITIDSLGIIAKNIVDEMGEPSYTSGDHI
jgi:hypothetical protein